MKLIKDFLSQFNRTPAYKWALLIYSGLIVFLIVIPLLFIAGFILGIANLQNPFSTALELVKEVC